MQACKQIGIKNNRSVIQKQNDYNDIVVLLCLSSDKSVSTTMAFVHTLPDGDREFSFVRDPGADMMLRKDEIDADIVSSAKIFHFGTLSSTHEGVREATRYAIDIAKESDALISFDPNLRPPLWESLDDAKKEIEYGLSKCDILKISDNEIEFMTGSTDYDKAVRGLMEKYNIKLAFANAAAAIITTRRGALKVMPEKEEILDLLRR